MNKLQLDITIRLTPVDDMNRYLSNSMELRENVVLTVSGFLAAAKVLGQFHDLAENLEKDS